MIIVFLSLFLSFAKAELPELYTHKKYVKVKSEKLGDKYYYTYVFKDEKKELQTWNWWVSAPDTDLAGSKFGVDSNFVNGRKINIQAAKNNYFVSTNGFLRPDYTALVNLYSNFAYPLYLKVKEHSLERNLTVQMQIELVLRILQDFPYGVVPTNFNGKFVNGLMPVTETFKMGWSDCDSKSLLMAAIFSHHPYLHDKMAMITVPGHALLGIQGIPRPYEKAVSYLGKKYIYAEPVGVTRTPFGKTNSPYSKSIEVYPLDVFYKGPKTDSGSLSGSTLSQSDCKDDSFLLDFTSKVTGIRTVACQIKRNGNFVNHGPEIVYKADGSVLSYKRYKNGVESNGLETSKAIAATPVAQKVLELSQNDCPSGSLLISFTSPVTGGKKMMCQIKNGGGYVNHGPTILYNKDGSIDKKQNFVMGVEQ